jgi:phosphate starvation-inducible PhoH-like protein
MGKKKNLSGITKEDLDIIDSALKNTYATNKNGSGGGNLLGYKVDLKCKNEKQKLHYKTIKEKEVVLISGSAGTGKSYVGFAAALELLKDPENKYKELLIVVPTIQSDIELGFLKGSLEEKIAPFTDAHTYTMAKIIGKHNVDKLILNKKIIFNVVSFMRGKTIDNTIVIIEEAQNLPKSAMKTLLTRIGENSKYIISGDYEQCDNKEIKKGKEDNGLKYVINKLSKLDEIGVVEYTNEEIVRNPLITKILNELD